MGYPSGKILLASTEMYENEQPAVLSVFQVCLQKRHENTSIPCTRSRCSLCHPTQENVSSLKWDPTGHLLLCLGKSEVVKILGRSGGSWLTLHSLAHTSAVNVAEWCPLVGRAPDPWLMMAASVSMFHNSASLNELTSNVLQSV